jgi:uncharacterized Tic20 family protein
MIKTTPASSDDRFLAIASHLGGLLVSFAVPLIIWLIAKESPTLRFASSHAKEALNYQITFIIVTIVGIFLCLILIGIPILFVLFILNIVWSIQASVSASNNQDYKYPLNFRLIS